MTTPRGLATLFLLLALASPTFAQAYTWTAGTNTDWSNPANWTPAGGPPNGAGIAARFDATTATNPVLNGTFTVGRLTIDRPPDTSFDVNPGSSGGTLVFNNGSSAAVVELLAADVSYFQSITVPMTIAGNNTLHLNVATGQILFLFDAISGTGSSVTVNAGGQGGRVFVSSTTAYGGAGSVTTVAGGLLNANDDGSLPANTALVLSGGVLEMNGSFDGTPAVFSRSLGTALGEVRLTGAEAGFSAWQADVTVRLNNGTGTVSWGSANFDPGVLILGHADSVYGTSVTFENGLDLNGATRTIRADMGAGQPYYGAYSRMTGVIGNSMGSAGLTKLGEGVLELTAANTYNGPTTVLGGVLRAADGVGLPTASNLTLDGGLYETLGPTTLIRNVGANPGEIQFGPNGGGFSAVGGTLTVRLNNGSAPVTWGAGGFVPAGLPLTLAGPGADALVDFQNGIDLAGATRSVVVNAGAAPTAIGQLSGVLSNGGLAVSGGGTLALTGANTYDGPTTLTGGTLRANHGHGLPAASHLTLDGGVLEGIGTAAFDRAIGAGPGRVLFGPNGGGFSASGGQLTVQLSGNPISVAWGSAGFVPVGAPLMFGSVVADHVTDFRNDLDLAIGDRTFLVADNVRVPTDIARLSGVISNGGIEKTGPGTLHLTAANTYSGQTAVREGALRAVDGVGLPATSHLLLDGGVFEGSGTFTRPLNVTGGGTVHFGGSGGFAAAGAPLVVQLNGNTNTVTWGTGGFFIPNNDGLIFGSATADNLVDFQNNIDLNGGQYVTVLATPGRPGAYARISGVLDNGDVWKYGAGTLELTAENTNYGGVRVAEGRLLVNNPDRTGASSIGVSSGTGIGMVEVWEGATLAGSGRIELQNSPGYFNYGSRLIPGGPAGSSLRIDVNGEDAYVFFDGTWVIRVTAAGTGGVANNSGASTAGAVPDPTNHNFLDLHTYTGTVDPVPDAFDFQFTTFEVDGTGANFILGQRYSYKVGKVATLEELYDGELDVTDQERFVAIGFDATDFSLTAGPDGTIYLNFTPVPEPGLALVVAAAGLGLLARRRLRG